MASSKFLPLNSCSSLFFSFFSMGLSLFLLADPIHDVLLPDLETIVSQPVKYETAGKVHEKYGHDDGHDEHHHDLSATLYPEKKYKDYRWAMAIDLDRKRFRCHHYGCTAGGGLLDLMFRMKHGCEPAGGKLRGDEFKEIVGDLQAIAGGAEPLPAATNTTISVPSRPLPDAGPIMDR